MMDTISRPRQATVGKTTTAFQHSKAYDNLSNREEAAEAYNYNLQNHQTIYTHSVTLWPFRRRICRQPIKTNICS